MNNTKNNIINKWHVVGSEFTNEYISNVKKNLACPYCQTQTVEFLDETYKADEDALSITHTISFVCICCDAQWEEEYKLTGVYEYLGPDRIEGVLTSEGN